VLIFNSFLIAQNPELGCSAVTTKKIKVTHLESGKSEKIEKGEEFKIVSWRINSSNFDHIYGQFHIPELIVEYDGQLFVSKMQNIDRANFKEPATNKEFWDIYVLQQDVLSLQAKNGVRVDLRNELFYNAKNYIDLLGNHSL